MAEIWQWNTSTTAERIRSGDISAREVADAHLARLDEVNPLLNAVTNDVRESAIARAAELDESFSASGPAGALHGVPVTIKENIDVEGQVTPNGMLANAEVVAPADSPLVSHFKNAGAVIIGRTNTPEMSYRWHTDNPLRGQTHNPWSASRTPGGSSGGAAASVAAGIGTIAHGNDLGGSVRQPANCCGLAGIRPSLGRVPAHNPSAEGIDRGLALQLMSVQGPLGREVADVRTGLEIMMQPSHQDPWYRQGQTAPPPHPCRVAATYGLGPIDAEARDAIDAAARFLIDAGYEVSFIDPPNLDEIRSGWRTILATETAHTIDIGAIPDMSDDLLNAVGWMFAGHITDVAGLVHAYARRHTILQQWLRFLAEQPLILAPVSQLVPFAPNDDASSRERFNEILEGHTCLVAVNYLGLPGAAVPATLTPDGPVGVQLIGAPFDEFRCLDAAAAIEAGAGIMSERLWAGAGRL
ncbi:MAG: amidase [Acidimicrobiales bacterium]|nr:MAG: amidase [Acidimicrobiales bacterium]